MAGGGQIAWAIEGTRHYGLGLARYLASAGQQVAETGSSRHVGKRRAGKSDPIDAVRAHRFPRSAGSSVKRPGASAVCLPRLPIVPLAAPASMALPAVTSHAIGYADH